MSIPVSTVPLALAAIKAATQAQVTENETQAGTVNVCSGDPGQTPENDIIIIGAEVRRENSGEALVGSGGQHWLVEEYEVDCLVSSWSLTTDPLVQQQRAYELVAYVETGVRSDPSLGGVVQIAMPFKTQENLPQIAEGGWLVEVTVTIRCLADS